MKHLTLIIFLFATTVLSAQHLGIKGGLNFTNVSSERDLNLSTSNGFHAGLTLDLSLPLLIDMSTGLIYTRRGYKSNEPGRVGNVSIDYLDVPIDLVFKFKVADLVGVYVSAGPYFSYGLSSQVFDTNGILRNGFTRDDIDLNRFDSGLSIGVGVDVSKFRLSTGYSLSLTDNGADLENRLENRIFIISLGYIIF